MPLTEIVSSLPAVACAIFLGSTSITLSLLFVIGPLLARYSLAHPNARSSHRVSTPQGAGIAVVTVTLAATAAVALFMTTGIPASKMMMLGFAALLLACTGAADDVYDLPVLPRFLLQVVAAALVIAAMPENTRLLPYIPFAFELALLLIALLWFTNLTNFMDGLDWMLVAEFVPLTAGLALFGFAGALPQGMTFLAVALCGAMLGFAPFNKPKASLFLGDVGSLPLGLLLATLLLYLAAGHHFAAALILPLYFAADATITLLRRAARGEAVWVAHRQHFYQRAMDGGLSVPTIVARIFATNVGLVILAGATIVWPTLAIAVSALLCAIALVAALLYSLARSNR